MTWFYVACGGALGAVARFAMTTAAARLLGSTFPWGTLAVNATGCFALGLLARLLLASAAPPAVRLALTTGFLGAFTTFSSFAWETLELVREDRLRPAAIYVAASLAAGLAAVWSGYALAQFMLARGVGGVGGDARW